ncbi:MAG: hypothetical protein BWX99_02672 [Deltaproteobacteria bacterium ADurb.Bin151]|nr:MAG: hypothetical protein BWX99_02672 [Deltaproteobacteria bacterium ADurb.Bin151]
MPLPNRKSHISGWTILETMRLFSRQKTLNSRHHTAVTPRSSLCTLNDLISLFPPLFIPGNGFDPASAVLCVVLTDIAAGEFDKNIVERWLSHLDASDVPDQG